MRGATLSFREWRPSGSPLSALGAFYRRHAGTLVIAIAGASFLAGVGAFETSLHPAAIVYPYWLILMLAGGHIAMITLDWLDEHGLFDDNPAARAGAVIAAHCLFQTPLVWAMAALALDGTWDFQRNFALLPQVLLVATGFVLLQHFATRPGTRRKEAEPVPAASPKARLIEREHSLYAVEAEDHYLRFHTETGSRLVLMRLTDALAELEGEDGARIHRSWWVSRAAVAHVSPKKGRATMVLRNGLVVPVSRTYARDLRKMGWY